MQQNLAIVLKLEFYSFYYFQIIEDFQKCHVDHPIGKFFGKCTELKIKLDRCFRQEVTFFKIKFPFILKSFQVEKKNNQESRHMSKGAVIEILPRVYWLRSLNWKILQFS